MLHNHEGVLKFRLSESINDIDTSTALGGNSKLYDANASHLINFER